MVQVGNYICVLRNCGGGTNSGEIYQVVEIRNENIGKIIGIRTALHPVWYILPGDYQVLPNPIENQPAQLLERKEIYLIFYRRQSNEPVRTYLCHTKADAESMISSMRRQNYIVLSTKKITVDLPA